VSASWTAVTVSVVGWRARDALGRSGGAARPIAPLARSIYLEAGGELVWLGEAGAPLHGRAMLTAVLPRIGEHVRVDAGDAVVWRPAALGGSRHAIEASTAALRETLPALGQARGLGALLAGCVPPFPLDGAWSRASALALACAAGDAAAALCAATSLVGLGPGLTPAGDDFVGGALFARRLLEAGEDAGWRRAASEIVAHARRATHPVSAALLGDLVGGHGHAALHEMAAALGAGDTAAALGAARALVAIGHSSGWDMLAGFLAGILGAAAFGGVGAVAGGLDAALGRAGAVRDAGVPGSPGGDAGLVGRPTCSEAPWTGTTHGAGVE
jgi:hypothetical protein